MVLPVRELENLIGTTEADALDITPLTSEEPAGPSQPVMAHMASMLEQAQLIARDLRPTPAPAPMSRAPAAPAHVTMRYANSLLEDSRFEEALQAFLELSHKNWPPAGA
jgi:hypothetical protein